MIELLHPITLGVAVACVPVAAVTVSGAIDLIAHRQQRIQPGRGAVDLSQPPSDDAAPLPTDSSYPVTPHP